MIRHAGRPFRRTTGRKAAMIVAVLSLAILLGAACGGSQEDDGLAPNFSLPDIHGQQVVLDDLVNEHESVVVVFYRGYF